METVYAVRNESAVLECIAVLPPFETDSTIGWTRVSDNTVISAHAPGNSMIRIDQVGEEDGGEYRCQLLTERSGSEDADIRLVVISKS